jgi:hypothetical protein
VNDFLNWLDASKLAIIVGGVATVVGGLGGSRIAARNARETVKQQHDLAVIDDERHERKSLYVDLLAYLVRCNVPISDTFPMFGGQLRGSQEDLPSWPSDDSLFALEARIAAFASQAVRDLVEDWLEFRGHFLALAGIIRDGHETDERLKLDDVRKTLFELCDKLKLQVNAELAPEPSPN